MTTITAPSRGYLLGHDITSTRNLDEALDLAGLNWNTNLVQADSGTLLNADGVTSIVLPPDLRHVVRDDNQMVLGVVGQKYHGVSNRDAFAIGDHWVREGAIPTRAGGLWYGRQVFMDFDFPQYSVGLAAGKDVVTWGARITTAHDGSGRVTARVVGKRLWCTNGCTVAISGVPHEFKVSHTASAPERLAMAAKVMQGAGRYVASWSAAAERMIATPMTQGEFSRYIDAIFPRPAEDATKNAVTIWENRRAELLELWRFAETNEVARGTRWAGLNAVTEYLDWKTPVRKTEGAPTVEMSRAFRHFEAAHQDTRNAAWDMVLAA